MKRPFKEVLADDRRSANEPGAKRLATARLRARERSDPSGVLAQEGIRVSGSFLLQINSASRWRFRPLLRLTFPLARTRLSVEPRPNPAPCSLQEQN